jgi:heat shock protein 90kDa beta
VGQVVGFRNVYAESVADESSTTDAGSASNGVSNAYEAPSSSSFMVPENAEKFAFEAEVNKMLDIVVNSLYQNKEVFLRELISNASDALDKIRLLLITEPEKYKSKEANIPLEVKISFDEEERVR